MKLIAMGHILNTISVSAQKATEQVRRATRTARHSSEIAERQRLAAPFLDRPGLPRLEDDKGHCALPLGTLPNLGPAVAFCRDVWAERGTETVNLKKQHLKKQAYRSTILAPRTYEEAPPLLDLALSDDILSIAMSYLREVPVLYNIELWATEANDSMAGSQYYHLDGQRWNLRRAKFLFNINDVEHKNGPFTFLPADVSRRVSQSCGRVRGRFTDDEVFAEASKSDEVALIGPAGTGAVVDSSRCFHFGARAKEGQRVLLMFHFLSLADILDGGELHRTDGFRQGFGDDPVRSLIVPHTRDTTAA